MFQVHRTNASDDAAVFVKEGGDVAAEMMDPKAQEDSPCERTSDGEGESDKSFANVAKPGLLEVGYWGKIFVVKLAVGSGCEKY